MQFQTFMNITLYYSFSGNKSSALHTFIQRSRSSNSRNDDIRTRTVIKKILEHASHSVLEAMELPDFPQNDCCEDIIKNFGRDDLLDAAAMKQSMPEWQNLRRLRITGQLTSYSLKHHLIPS